MSKRRPAQHRAAWLAYCERRSEAISQTGLPSDLFRDRGALEAFLATGHESSRGIALDAMSAEQFWTLFDLVNNWYDAEVGAFTALERRRIGG